MERKDLVKRLGIVYFFIFAAAPLSYLIRVIYARGLTAEQYGLFYALISFIGLIAIFNNLGTGPAMIYYLPKFLNNSRYNKIKLVVSTVFSIELLTSIFFVTLCIMFRKDLAHYFFKNEEAYYLLPLFMFIFVSQNLFNWLMNFFKGYGKEIFYSSMNPIRLLIVLVFSFISSFYFKENLLLIFALVWIISYIISILAYSIPFYKLFRPAWKVKASFNRGLLRQLLHYGFFVMITAATGMLLERVNVLMLTYMKGLEAVAFYEIAFPIASAIFILVNPLTAFLFPSISKFHHEKDYNFIKYIFGAIYNTGFFLYFPLGLLLFLFPREIILIFFGAKYLPAGMALQILSIGCIFQGLCRINFTFLDGIGQIKKRSHILYWGAGTNVLLNLILIPLFGIEGAAFSTSMGFGIMFLLSLLYLSKNVGFRMPYKNWGKILLSSFFLSLVALFLNKIISFNLYLKLIFIIILLGFSYLFIGIKWKIIDINLLKMLWSKQFEKNK